MSTSGNTYDATVTNNVGENVAGNVAATVGMRNGTSSVTVIDPLPLSWMMPHAEKPPSFSGSDFKRWQQKVLFYLTTLGLAGFLKEDKPDAPSEEKANLNVRFSYDNWCNGDILCRNSVLNCLYHVYVNVKTSKELWETLDRKYRIDDDARPKKLVVAKFLDYKMVDFRPVLDQVQEFELLVHDVHAEGMVLPDAFIVAAVIGKLPPSWKSFKSYLVHKQNEMSLEDLIVKIRTEADMRSCISHLRLTL